jgi:hypothetical protein
MIARKQGLTAANVSNYAHCSVARPPSLIDYRGIEHPFRRRRKLAAIRVWLRAYESAPWISKLMVCGLRKQVISSLATEEPVAG